MFKMALEFESLTQATHYTVNVVQRLQYVDSNFT